MIVRLPRCPHHGITIFDATAERRTCPQCGWFAKWTQAEEDGDDDDF